MAEIAAKNLMGLVVGGGEGGQGGRGRGMGGGRGRVGRGGGMTMRKCVHAAMTPYRYFSWTRWSPLVGTPTCLFCLNCQQLKYVPMFMVIFISVNTQTWLLRHFLRHRVSFTWPQKSCQIWHQIYR